MRELGIVSREAEKFINKIYKFNNIFVFFFLFAAEKFY